MPDSVELKVLDRDGVRLAYVEAGPVASATPPIVFVHGWCCDHSVFAPEIVHFARTRRVVAVDLRGHGKSDAPKQVYTLAAFADDLAWQCQRLGLHQPVIVGHSMGGNAALEFASRYPDLPTAIVMIDSVVLPPAGFAETLAPLVEALRSPAYLAAMQAAASGLFIETDDPARRTALLKLASDTPQHVIESSFVNHITDYDATAAAKACKTPIAYIAASVPLIESGRNLERFKQLCPQLVTAKTLGAGHYSPLEVPDQINAMLERFLAVGLG